MGIRTAAVFVAVAPALLAQAQTAVSFETLRLSPAEVRTLGAIETDGKPWRLAWSPDGSELYVQVLQGGYADAQSGRGKFTLQHYVLSATDGARKDLQGEPDWAREYWTMKSNRHAPNAPELAIALKNEVRIEQTTVVPRGGDLAKGGTTTQTGTGAGDAATAAYNRQNVHVNFYEYRGERIGEFVNSVVVHGLTFGWGPMGSNLIAYATPKDGRIVVMDESGRKKDVPGTKHALLPAWSIDGGRIAWIEKEGRRKFELKLLDVGA